MKEIFKDIPNYKGLYQVSNLGNIKSFNRRNSLYFKILKPQENHRGYFHVTLCKDGIKKTLTIHSLVWKSFKGEVPNGFEIDHKIENKKSDNRLVNLQLLTKRENINKNYRLKNTTSKYAGVSFRKSRNKFIARIRLNGKLRYLGTSESELECYNMYLKAIKENNICLRENI